MSDILIVIWLAIGAVIIWRLVKRSRDKRAGKNNP